ARAPERPAPKRPAYARPSRTPEPGQRPRPSTAPTPEPEPEPEPPRSDDEISDAERAEMVADAHNSSPDPRVDPATVALELLQSQLGATPLE
ncbi:MAG: DNA polymerase III subunit gamma/tau, partial [Gordonia sp. (in: high G+C Gram-positive bacteria)]